MKRTLKVYQVEIAFRYGFGLAVVAAYGMRSAEKLAMKHAEDGWPRDFEGLLSPTEELTTLTPTVTKPEILVWGHHIE